MKVSVDSDDDDLDRHLVCRELGDGYFSASVSRHLSSSNSRRRVQVSQFIPSQTALTSVNASNACMPASRPMPLFFTPPNGT